MKLFVSDTVGSRHILRRLYIHLSCLRLQLVDEQSGREALGTGIRLAQSAARAGEGAEDSLQITFSAVGEYSHYHMRLDGISRYIS